MRARFERLEEDADERPLRRALLGVQPADVIVDGRAVAPRRAAVHRHPKVASVDEVAQQQEPARVRLDPRLGQQHVDHRRDVRREAAREPDGDLVRERAFELHLLFRARARSYGLERAARCPRGLLLLEALLRFELVDRAHPALAEAPDHSAERLAVVPHLEAVVVADGARGRRVTPRCQLERVHGRRRPAAHALQEDGPLRTDDPRGDPIARRRRFVGGVAIVVVLLRLLGHEGHCGRRVRRGQQVLPAFQHTRIARRVFPRSRGGSVS